MNKDYLTEWLKTYLPQRDLKWREGFAKELLALFEAEQKKGKRQRGCPKECIICNPGQSILVNSKGGANE